MTQDNVQARRHLDARFRRLRSLAGEPRPHKGWIRAVRDAIGMSSAELGARVGVSQQRAIQMEQSEVQDAITLGTLRRAADGLDCDLVYVLVPRASLEEMVEEQAHTKAIPHLGPIAHHSRLENQESAPDDQAAQLDQLAAHFVDRRGLWAETNPAP